MNTAISPEMETLKTKLKTTWEAGDFAEIAKGIETTAEAFVERLNIEPGTKVLDVACGSGNLAIIAAKKGAEVTGIDIAENLIDAAKRRAAAEGLEIKFEQGDAEAMPYAEDSFDLVMTMFGAMFAPRPAVTASELVRVCKPGGRIAMANWTPTGFAGQMFKLSTKYLPPPDMPPPVLWGVPDEVRARFDGRVTDLQITPRMADMQFDFPPEDVVALFKKYFGPTVMAFKALDPSRHQELTDDMLSLWNENNISTDGKTHAKGEYLEVIATK
ncbi:MAG: class I SAM-dependent methyltransferase [Chloracidobacterium sp.]|nr:class I SAM-dependent methyltransferase [Chloracidobacterium sp.]